jgi:hypothetical protein
VEDLKKEGKTSMIDTTHLHVFEKGNTTVNRKIHYAVTLGGDGTILYAAKQFHEKYIPSIISFALVSDFIHYICIRVHWATCVTSSSMSTRISTSS